MTRVFLSGSRQISRLHQSVLSRLAKMIDNELTILIGDANGADKAMQSYFNDRGYRNVQVFCSGDKCRNNVGGWTTKNILVAPHLKGRAFYTEKDKAMAKEADLGFVLWDGKSKGSVANALELLDAGKRVVLFHSDDKSFYNFKTKTDLQCILQSGDLQSGAQSKSNTRSGHGTEQSSLQLF
ncbi:MAG TPA: hypothetical protein EYG57_09315 [Planctomycetes bacterium]|uniref:hypothetical protein n=1 Tax=Henriciella sp. TaxID=1968823 RepID=UPI0017D0086B|nr:hypothetical protein [Henriciella sp.]HIG21758.1 hypothetical protein [Henriciella sp.]HIM29745.1 hypothetical protein [Planctomycetota bacterium]